MAPLPVLSAFRCCLLLLPSTVAFWCCLLLLCLFVAFHSLASLLVPCLSMCLLRLPLSLGSHQSSVCWFNTRARHPACCCWSKQRFCRRMCKQCLICTAILLFLKSNNQAACSVHQHLATFGRNQAAVTAALGSHSHCQAWQPSC